MPRIFGVKVATEDLNNLVPSVWLCKQQPFPKRRYCVFWNSVGYGRENGQGRDNGVDRSALEVVGAGGVDGKGVLR